MTGEGFAKKDISVSQEEIGRFYDALMALVSYSKYRDFYDSYVEPFDISYDDFVKEINKRGLAIAGGYGSKLIGYHRKGRKIIVVIETEVAGEGRKKISLGLMEKKEGLKISSKEFFKICHVKKTKRRYK